jgi:hypothetical protein
MNIFNIGDRVQFDGIAGVVTGVTCAGTKIAPFRIYTVDVDIQFWDKIISNPVTVTSWNLQ